MFVYRSIPFSRYASGDFERAGSHRLFCTINSRSHAPIAVNQPTCTNCSQVRLSSSQAPPADPDSFLDLSLERRRGDRSGDLEGVDSREYVRRSMS